MVCFPSLLAFTNPAQPTAMNGRYQRLIILVLARRLNWMPTMNFSGDDGHHG